MTEAARKKKTGIVRKPKRTVRKPLAIPSPSPSPPTTSSPTSSSPTINQQLAFRTRSEPQFDQPPRYSILFPPEQIDLSQRPVQSLHPPPHITSRTLCGPGPLPVIDNGFPIPSSTSALTPSVIHPEIPIDDIFFEQQRPSPDAIAHEALREVISTKFDSVITSIDGEQFGGDEQELFIEDDAQSGIRGGWGYGTRQVSRGANRAISTAVVGTNYFAKVNLYANSKLPPNLPPLQL